MEKIIHIEGMGCSGLRLRTVKKKGSGGIALVALAQVSKNSKTAKVTLNEALADAILAIHCLRQEVQS